MRGPPTTEWRWFVTDTHEVMFASGYKGYGGTWNFKGHEVSEGSVYMEEAMAIKAAKDRLKKIIASYKSQLDKLNKRTK